MYHRVSPDHADEMTVTMDQLDAQLAWVKAEGFHFPAVSEIVENRIPRMSVLVTFDDAYLDTFVYARPVLASLGIRPAVFVPTAYIGSSSAWDIDAHPIMTASQLRLLAVDGYEIGLHSHLHGNYAALAPEEIDRDLREATFALKTHGLPPARVFAYPFGGRPQSPAASVAMKVSLRTQGISLGFRIGNRVNPLPLPDPLEIQRLSVRGDRDLRSFKRQVAFGKLF